MERRLFVSALGVSRHHRACLLTHTHSTRSTERFSLARTAMMASKRRQPGSVCLLPWVCCPGSDSRFFCGLSFAETAATTSASEKKTRQHPQKKKEGQCPSGFCKGFELCVDGGLAALRWLPFRQVVLAQVVLAALRWVPFHQVVLAQVVVAALRWVPVRHALGPPLRDNCFFSANTALCRDRSSSLPSLQWLGL